MPGALRIFAARQFSAPVPEIRKDFPGIANFYRAAPRFPATFAPDSGLAEMPDRTKPDHPKKSVRKWSGIPSGPSLSRLPQALKGRQTPVRHFQCGADRSVRGEAVFADPDIRISGNHRVQIIGLQKPPRQS